VNNENSGNGERKGFMVRQVLACEHVGINQLVLRDTVNFYIKKCGYVVFEEEKCKVVCPSCLLLSSQVFRAK